MTTIIENLPNVCIRNITLDGPDGQNTSYKITVDVFIETHDANLIGSGMYNNPLKDACENNEPFCWEILGDYVGVKITNRNGNFTGTGSLLYTINNNVTTNETNNQNTINDNYYILISVFPTRRIRSSFNIGAIAPINSIYSFSDTNRIAFLFLLWIVINNDITTTPVNMINSLYIFFPPKYPHI